MIFPAIWLAESVIRFFCLSLRTKLSYDNFNMGFSGVLYDNACRMFVRTVKGFSGSPRSTLLVYIYLNFGDSGQSLDFRIPYMKSLLASIWGEKENGHTYVWIKDRSRLLHVFSMCYNNFNSFFESCYLRVTSRKDYFEEVILSYKT